MRREGPGAVYLTVIGIETVVVLGAASAIGEGLSGRELVGGALVIGGVAFPAS